MKRMLTTAVVAAAGCALLGTAAFADEAGKPGPAAEGEKVQLYAPPHADAVQKKVFNWVAAQEVKDKAILEKVGAVWAGLSEQETAEDLLDRAVLSFAVVDADVRDLVLACKLIDAPLLAPEEQYEKVFEGREKDAFFDANVRLSYARYLVRRRMYNMALDVYEDIKLTEVVDPAGALFHKAVCEHSLLMKTDGLKTIASLLHNTEDVPTRYATVATLMQFDLEALREKTLDEVARKMSDVGRELDLARTGPRVQKTEDEIVATLDEIIKKIEQQQGGGGGSSSGPPNGGQNQSSSPASDSGIKGQTAPGTVENKKVGSASGWGSLPEKERTDAKNIFDKRFPPYYQEMIRKYSRKIARRRQPPRD